MGFAAAIPAALESAAIAAALEATTLEPSTVAAALESIATLLLMCDARDLGTSIGERPPSPGSDIEWEEAASPEAIAALAEKEFFEPNLYLFDAYPGGI